MAYTKGHKFHPKKENEELVNSPEYEMKRVEMATIMRRDFPLMFMEMNDAQDRFIRVKNRFGRTPLRRLFEAGNKEGKCISYYTLIDTPSGQKSVGELFEDGRPFDVYSWDGEKRVIGHASPPFRKEGTHKCYQIEMSNGQSIEAADLHKVLVSGEGWQTVQCLYEYFLSLSRSKRESSLSVVPSGVVSLSGIESGYQGNYFLGYHQYDEQLHSVVNTVRYFVPLKDDVQRHIFLRLNKDVLGSKYANILRLEFSLLSSLYDHFRFVALSFESLMKDAYMFVQRCIDEFQVSLQLSTVVDGQLQPYGVFYQSVHLGFPLNDMANFSHKPPLDDGNYIISIKPIGVKHCFDFSVDKYHNYFAGGLINHNTYAGLAEDISYAVGYRCWLPPDDPDHKINIKVPNIGLIGCETKIHSVAEKLEPVLRVLVPRTCQPVFKPGPNGVLSSVILPYGPYGEKCGSKFYLRSYDERPETFEGIDFDWEHWDEPPPERVFLAAERGKIVTNAPSWFTMTPLKEPWIYERFSSKAAVCV